MLRIMEEEVALDRTQSCKERSCVNVLFKETETDSLCHVNTRGRPFIRLWVQRGHVFSFSPLKTMRHDCSIWGIGNSMSLWVSLKE